MNTLGNFSLVGKKAIVTGAGKISGLCCAMAKALHSAGAQVVLWDVSPQVHEICKDLGGSEAGFFAIQADLRDHEAAEKGFAMAVEQLGGRLDILLNGAGAQYRCDAIDYPEDKWNFILDINLSSVFFLSQIAAKHMIENGSGRIINIASMTSYVASRRIPAYSASKGGVMQLTKALSNEWAPLGINVNAIAPGYMKTEQTADYIETELGRQHTSRIPMGRWGTPEDLDGTVVFLASEASSYISGAIIPVDGGYLGL